MRKRILVVILAICVLGMFFSCDELGIGNNNGSGGDFKLAPSDWTIGSWQVYTNETEPKPKTTFIFSSDNLVITNQIEADQPARDFNDMANEQGYTITETVKTSEKYEVKCERGLRSPEPPPGFGPPSIGGTQTFTFTKNVDSNKIDISIKTGDTTNIESGTKL